MNLPLVIHLLVPISGVIYFFVVRHKMNRELGEGVHEFHLFFEFFCYGGLLAVTLTDLFWEWSGAASLVMFFLITVAPVGMAVIGYQNSKKKEARSHFILFLGGVLYIPVLIATFAISVVVALIKAKG
jgi:hypothetical protein